MSKLFLLCVLATVLLASSSSEVVTEADELVLGSKSVLNPTLIESDSTQGSVDALQVQFEEINASLKDGSKVSRTMKQTINTMISLIKSSIEPLITTGHATDQARIHESHRAVKDFNSAWRVTRKALYVDSGDARNEIRTHNNDAKLLAKDAQTHKDSVKDYEAKVSQERKDHCEKKNSAVPQVSYPPNGAVCAAASVSSAKTCIAAAQTALTETITANMTSGFNRYKAAIKALESSIAAKKSARTAIGVSSTQCSKRIGIVTNQRSVVYASLRRLKKLFKDASSKYNSKHSKVIASYNKARKDVEKNEQTRKLQWASVVEIKCMLTKVRDGGKFDGKDWAKCKCFLSKKAMTAARERKGKELLEQPSSEIGFMQQTSEERASVCIKHLNIKYRKVPTKLVWVRKPYKKLTNIKPYKKKCAIKERANEKAKCRVHKSRSIQRCKTFSRWSTAPTKAPTRRPTKTPTKRPTRYPTKYPTRYPTKYPTKNPTPHVNQGMAMFRQGSYVNLIGGRGQICSDRGFEVQCNRNYAQQWERFRIIPLGSSRYGLISGKSGQYCSQDNTQRWNCNRNHLGPWEKFKVVPTPGANSNQVALIGGQSGLYCADLTNNIACNSDSIGSSGTFSVRNA